MLAGLIAGAKTEGLIFTSFIHNDKHRAWDEQSALEKQTAALDLTRVFVITTEATASASESLINGLRPHVDVRTIGATTHGKPVGMYSWNFCDLVAVPISFEIVNADGAGGYYDGLAPDCLADDLLTVPAGDVEETSLAEAPHLLEFGTCSTSDGAKHAQLSREIPLRGFRMAVGAH